MSVLFVVCSVGSGFCEGLVTRAEECYWIGACLCVCVCVCVWVCVCVGGCVCVCEVEASSSLTHVK